jgi:hypothetical protein
MNIPHVMRDIHGAKFPGKDMRSLSPGAEACVRIVTCGMAETVPFPIPFSKALGVHRL